MLPPPGYSDNLLEEFCKIEMLLLLVFLSVGYEIVYNLQVVVLNLDTAKYYLYMSSRR